MQWHEANVNDFLLGRFCPLFLLPSLPLFLLLLCYPFRVSIGFMFILFLLGRFCPGPPLLWCRRLRDFHWIQCDFLSGRGLKLSTSIYFLKLVGLLGSDFRVKGGIRSPLSCFSWNFSFSSHLFLKYSIGLHHSLCLVSCGESMPKSVLKSIFCSNCMCWGW